MSVRERDGERRERKRRRKQAMNGCFLRREAIVDCWVRMEEGEGAFKGRGSFLLLVWD